MLDDFDLDFPEDEEELEEEGGAPSNRTFIMIAGGLGGVIIIALICIFVYVNFFGGPSEEEIADQTQTAIAYNNATNVAGTETALAAIPTDTPTLPPTDTPTQEPTGTATLEGIPTATLDPGGGPTADPRTATVESLLTQAAQAQTEAASQILTSSPTPTALPDTGVIDDIIDSEDGTGANTLLILAVFLLVIIFAARQIRKATS